MNASLTKLILASSLIGSILSAPPVFAVNGTIANFRVAATKTDVLAKMGGVTKAKLVFQMNNKLYFVDYSEATPQIRQMVNVSNAEAPDISPDGKFVTWDNDTKEKDFTQIRKEASSVYACSISVSAIPVQIASTGYNPRFIKDSLNNPTIVYMTACTIPAGKSYVWQGGKTVKKTFNGTTVGAEQTICNGAYRGGISRGGQYIATAEQFPSPSSYLLDLVNGNGVPAPMCMDLFTGPGKKDTIAPISGQNCNSSISTSFKFPNLIMNLTSATEFPAGYTDPFYGSFVTHEYCPISNNQGRIVKVFGAAPFNKIVADPQINDCTFLLIEQPEWTNNPYWVVFMQYTDRLIKNPLNGAWDHLNSTEHVALHNLKDSSYVNLVEVIDTTISTMAYYPIFWSELPANFAASEDANYLKPRTVGIIHGNSSLHSASSLIRIDNLTLNSVAGIKSVGIFRLDGVRINSVDFGSNNVRSYSIEKMLGSARGTYFVKAVAEGGKSAVFRITTVN